MKSTTLRSAVAAVLTAALSAVVLPASAASAAENPAADTVDATTVRSFGRLADAVLTQRTAALLDDKQPARRAAPLAERNVRLSAAETRTEDTALSALRTRKARLARLGEAYTSADTRVAVDRVRVEAGRATAWATETTTLTYAKIRGDEPSTTGFQAHHRLSFAATADGRWQLTGLTSTDDGPLAVNDPGSARVAAGTTALPEATPAAISVPSRPQTKPAGSHDFVAMASYAEKYWQNYNPAYRKFNEAGGDCTNFVSQALRAGGWADTSGDSDDYRSWWYNTSYQSTSWVGANEWSWFTLDAKRATNLANVYYMGVGDVMQMDFDKDGSKDHTMIVTYRSASGVPYLTYHSVNTYRRSVASIIASYPNSTYYAYRT